MKQSVCQNKCRERELMVTLCEQKKVMPFSPTHSCKLCQFYVLNNTTNKLCATRTILCKIEKDNASHLSSGNVMFLTGIFQKYFKHYWNIIMREWAGVGCLRTMQWKPLLSINIHLLLCHCTPITTYYNIHGNKDDILKIFYKIFISLHKCRRLQIWIYWWSYTCITA
jgi:hypothetical protein